MLINQNFFLQPVIEVAKNLLGVELSINNHRGIITETESYKETEPSSHSYKATLRTKPTFEVGGTIYVYSIHQCFCMNIASNAKGIGDAVLIRGFFAYDNLSLYDGPGKLCKYLNINKSHNFLKLATNKLEINKLDSKSYSLAKVNQQKLVEIPYNIKNKRQQFNKNFIFNSSSKHNLSIINNNDLYYYCTPRIGLNAKNNDFSSLERFVLAEFNTKKVI